MVTARQAYLQTKKSLAEAGNPDAAMEASLLLQQVAGFSRFDEGSLTAEENARLQWLVKQRAAGHPLQYLLGSWPFMELELEVGPGVLIPRPETELVCMAALACVENIPSPRVLDLCSGTGALALGIQKEREDANVTAVELYGPAYRYLASNIASFSGMHAKAPAAVQADALLYAQKLPPASLDLLVSNPPYVTLEEYAALAPELYHEPRTALLAPCGGLAFYMVFAEEYYAALRPGGFIVLEIGAKQGAALKKILAQNGYTDIQIKQDYAGLDRIALAQKPR